MEALQFVLAARLSWVETPFGLDVLMRFHRAMALAAPHARPWHRSVAAAPREHFIAETFPARCVPTQTRPLPISTVRFSLARVKPWP
jgi:hypothetical protein